MSEHDELSRLIREALPPRTAPASLRDWAHARARAHDAGAELGAGEEPDAGGVTPIRRRPEPVRVRPWRGPALRAAALLLAASLGFAGHAVIQRDGGASGNPPAVVARLVDDHVESLMADHLMDVPSTDQHTVKPWFIGRADFAPRVVALDSAGFPLLGGRLAYVEGHTAAVLVYGRRKHVINVFMWRDPGAAATNLAEPVTRYSGYAVAHWTAGGLSFWAVTDATPADLEAFRAAYMAE